MREPCCARCVDEIAARAGVCRRMVQNAIREAARLGLVTIEERRREGRRNLPNVIRIVSKEWTMWLARAGRSTRPTADPLIGCKKMRPTDSRYKNQRPHTSERSFAAKGQQAGLAVQHHKSGPSVRRGDVDAYPTRPGAAGEDHGH